MTTDQTEPRDGTLARPRRWKPSGAVDDLDPRWDLDFLAACAEIEEHGRYLEQVAAEICARLKLSPLQLRNRRLMADLTFDEQEAIEHAADRAKAERIAEAKANRRRMKVRLRRRRRRARHRIAAQAERVATDVNRADEPIEPNQPNHTEPNRFGQRS